MTKFFFRTWPTESRRITQHFGMRPEVYAKFGLAGHEGIDFGAPVGANVFCVANGTVAHVFPADGRPYGINVRVRHVNGYETIYAHLQEAKVTEGQRVRAGQVVGLVGMTGNTEGPHLHLTLKQEDTDLPGYPNHIIDPTPFLMSLLDANWVDATFVRDLIPDGTIFQAEAPFTQTWFFRNSGNRAWAAGDTLAHISGPTLGAPNSLPLPAIPPGAEAPVTVQMSAPNAAGRHLSVWQPRSADGELFGDPVWVEIEVPEPIAAARAMRGFFVKAVGQQFMIQERPFRFFGYNLRGLAHYGRRTSDPLMFSRPEHQLSQLQAVYDLGARVVRLFLPDRTVARHEIQARLRTLLDIVDSRFPDLYLLPAFTNLYHDVPFQHPGDDESWLFSGPLLSRDFFANRFRENYLPFVEQIVTAFRDDSNILAWEIGNELKLDRADLNNPNDPNPWLFVHFNLETAAAIKRSDPNHLVTTGMKATHHAWLHTTALQEELYRSPNIDFLTIHSYEGKWDREGDMRVYDDASLAARCNKPFIVEEAGFDRELFPDRPAKHREHIDRWLSLGASGYMPWGFIHAREIGDGDDSVGISAEHGDFQALCDLFRNYAAQLNASSRGMARAFIPMPAPLPLPRGARGITGFDFQGYNQQFVRDGGETPVNDAVSYGVGVHPVNAPAGATYWKVVGIHHLTPTENRSRHNIYVDVLDEQGQRIRDVLVGWNWEGNNEAPPEPKRLDKPESEPACDIPISEGTFKLWLTGAPSEEVFGIHYRHADEPAPDGELLNTFGHHSFYVVYQRARKGVIAPVEEGGETGVQPEQPVIVAPPPILPQPLLPGRVRVKEKLGIDANRPIDPRSGALAPQVADPAIIADIGVGWVRLNFVLGEPWSGPNDQNRPLGRTWAETYQGIIDGFRNRGLKVYGLISSEAMRDDPGDQFRDPIAGHLSNDWIERYATSFAQIVELFHRDVEHFESFNEPDDWHNSNRNWMHPTWFALLLQQVHKAVRSSPALAHVKLISGPLQGLDINNNGGARYLGQTYAEGQRLFGWGQPGTPFPFDGVGYHLYLAQNPANPTQEIQEMYRRYMDGVRQVIRGVEGADKPLYLSEIGWESHMGDDRQAECLRIGLKEVLDDSSVALGIWFCTQDFALKYGLYREGGLNAGQRKPVYAALQAMCALPNEVPVPAIGAGVEPVGFDDAKYVRDTVPDGSKWQPGQVFTQTWTLRNTGSRAWSAGYRLVWIDGKSLGSPPFVPVPACLPGGEVSISVPFRAPLEAGAYESYWKLVNPQDERFGERVWIAINVEAPRALALAVPPAEKAALELDLELVAAWRRLAQRGFVSTERFMDRLEGSLANSVVQAESETLTLAALTIAYHAYWAQMANLTLGSDSRLAVQEAAGQALANLSALLAHQQARGGGVPGVLPTPALPVPPPPSAGTPGRRRALCIGIDAYSQQPLAGCVADARLWTDTLISLGFEPPMTLLDGQATRQNILQALQELVQASRAGDVIVFQYAGHGTQLPDADADEQGGDTPEQDEALVPFDFVQGAYVIDDDLAALFAAIPAGVNVTCFMDCCHSGTISRMLVGGPANGAQRAVDQRPRFMVATQAMKESYLRFRKQLGGSRAVRARGPETMHEVVFSACRSTEVAWESNGHGEFTLLATTTLKAAGGTGISHEAFMEHVVAGFGANPRQHPVLDCAPDMRTGALLQALVG